MFEISWSPSSAASAGEMPPPFVDGISPSARIAPSCVIVPAARIASFGAAAASFHIIGGQSKQVDACSIDNRQMAVAVETERLWHDEIRIVRDVRADESTVPRHPNDPPIVVISDVDVALLIDSNPARNFQLSRRVHRSLVAVATHETPVSIENRHRVSLEIGHDDVIVDVRAHVFGAVQQSPVI